MDLNHDGTGTPGGAGVVVALLTPPGRGALAVVGVAGAAAARIVDRLFTPRGGRAVAERPIGAVAFGRWGGDRGEEVVVVRPAVDRLEVHCHGGLAAAAAIVAGIVAQGGREIVWREWLGNVEGRPGAVTTEARAALAVANGPRAAMILGRQLAGCLEEETARIGRLVAAGDAAAARVAAERLLRAARVGLRLTRPWRVVVVGRVNVGKSSLINALAGYARAIVSPVPGTTRDVLETRTVLGGWEVELVDTAGERGPEADLSAVEAAGIARAAAAAETADLVLRVESTDGARAVEPPARRELLVLSKCDLAAGPTRVPSTPLRTSAATGEGIGELVNRIVADLVPEEAVDPELLAGAVPFTPRQVELIRASCGV